MPQDGDTPAIPRADYEGQIAAAPPIPIDHKRLLIRFPQLREHFQWIQPEFLLPIVEESLRGSPAPNGPGPRNEKLESLADELIAGQIAESMPRNRGTAGDSGSRTRILWHSAFCVPKKQAGWLRFILSGKTVNRLLANLSLPTCQFPSYRVLVDRILSQSHFAQYDFKSYFFSIPPRGRCSQPFRFSRGS